ncbi:MAG: hypothetical protein ACP5IL_11300, partial [Syntrophobacteraceae bacterium]
GFLEEFHRTGIGKSKEIGCNLVQSLSQSFSRRNLGDSQGFPEILVFPSAGDRLKITLPNCKESEITAQDIVQPNATRAYWKALLGLDRKSAQTIDTVSDEYESRVGGIEFFVGLLDNNALHVHLVSEFL